MTDPTHDDTAPLPNRPRIICHMIMSVDGRLLVERWTPPARGIARERLDAHYEEIASRLEADGWIAGRISVEKFLRGAEPAAPSSSAPTPPTRNLRTTHVADRQGRDVAVVVDPRGRLRYGADHAGSDHLIAIVGAGVSDEYLAELQSVGVSYVVAGADGPGLRCAMNELHRVFGLETLLLEGGGYTNGTFLAAGLIDEFSLLVYPGIDGLAGVPSIVGHAGLPGTHPAHGRALRHMATETLAGGVVWLRYGVEAAPGPNADAEV